MTIPPERVEAAARALWSRSSDIRWDILSDDYKAEQVERVKPILAAAFPELAAGTGWIAPWDDTEAMWGGLARQIVMWRDMGRPTGAALYQHLHHSEEGVPDWLPGLIDDIDHVPPKGAVAGAIYRAMRDAHLTKDKPG